MFRVDQCGVRERMERLKTDYKAKMREEESASGITVEEMRELDALVCKIIEREKWQRKHGNLMPIGRGSQHRQKSQEKEKWWRCC